MTWRRALFGLSAAIAVLMVSSLASTDALSVDAAPTGTVIGIDLGTTFSCVGVWRGGSVEIIPNEQGNRITPSWVSFTKDEGRVVGEASKNMGARNPKNTIYDVKRLIGRRFSDDEVQEDMKTLPYDVVDVRGKPHVSVSPTGGGVDAPDRMLLSAEEISAMILGKMKTIAEDYLGEEVTSAVVTVPAYFNDVQRQATKDAGRIAGLNVLKILNEPTAAAIAFGLDKRGRKRTVLVFDLGGGTFDVSLLTIKDGTFEVLGVAGDTHLGGSDFDQRLVEWLADRFKMKHEVDLRGDPKAMAKLRREAEKAKRVLSTEIETVVEVEAIGEGIDLREKITRTKFEQLNNDLFRKTLKPIQRVLEDADVRTNEVDDVVLVGGSTRIPKIQELISVVFKGKDPVRGVNPDEAVAHGAAIQAASLSDGQGEVRLELMDVTPLSLGVKASSGTMATLIKRNSALPVSKSKMFSTSRDNQERVDIHIYEGERPLVKDNHLLGHFALEDLPPRPRGKTKVKVTFSVDEDGILTVGAVLMGYGSIANNVSISSEDTGRLTAEEIERMINQADEFAERDAAVLAAVEARNRLESYAYRLRFRMDDEESWIHQKLTANEAEIEGYTLLEGLIIRAVQMVEAEADTDTADGLGATDYDAMYDEIYEAATPLLERLQAEWEEERRAAGLEEEEGGEGGFDGAADEGLDPHDEL